MEAKDIDKLIAYHREGLAQYRLQMSPSAQVLEELTIKALELFKEVTSGIPARDNHA